MPTTQPFNPGLSYIGIANPTMPEASRHRSQIVTVPMDMKYGPNALVIDSVIYPMCEKNEVEMGELDGVTVIRGPRHLMRCVGFQFLCWNEDQDYLGGGGHNDPKWEDYNTFAISLLHA